MVMPSRTPTAWLLIVGIVPAFRSVAGGQVSVAGDADAGCETTKAKLILQVTVFGKLSNFSAEEERKHLEQAHGYILPIFIRSMLGREGHMDMPDFDDIKQHVVQIPPFEKDPLAPNGRDYGSPVPRTHFRTEFIGVNKCGPMKEREGDEGQKVMSQSWNIAMLALYPCLDYDRQTGVLKAIVRALDKAEVYPREALQSSADLGKGLKAMLHILTAVEYMDGDGEYVPDMRDFEPSPPFGCNWKDQPDRSGELGPFFLPECPPFSSRWTSHCHCEEGYDVVEGVLIEGKMRIGFSDTPPFVTVGHCAKDKEYCNNFQKATKIPKFCSDVEGYCKLKVGDLENGWVLKNGSAATGRGGEEAWPKCENHEYPSGSATCDLHSRAEGQWSSSPYCIYDSPHEPPAPSCDAPDFDEDDGVKVDDCDRCVAAREWDKQTCNCNVACREGYARKGGGEEGPKTCGSKAATCPTGEKRWDESASPGARCLILREDGGPWSPALSGEVQGDWCCPEAWGNRMGPEEVEESDSGCGVMQTETQCRKATFSDKPCCWNENGFESYPGKDKCAQKGYHEEETYRHCAVLDYIPEALWNEEFPECVPYCSTTTLDGVINLQKSEGCKKCPPGMECDCRVHCVDNTIKMGGGDEGDLRCGEDGKFSEPPFCLGVPPVMCTPPISATVKTVLDGQCLGCKAGVQEGCDCFVECEKGHIKKGGSEGQKFCEATPAMLTVVDDCSKLMTSDDCLNSKIDGDVPCCWREGGFAGFFPSRCLPRGHKHITSEYRHDQCAELVAFTWNDLPFCKPLCDEEKLYSSELASDVDFSNCFGCVSGEDCACEVNCKRGYLRYGGGSEGLRKCTDDLTWVDKEGNAVGLPVCYVPTDGEESGPPAGCNEPAVSSTSTMLTNCDSCEAGKECHCHVECREGYEEWTEDGKASVSGPKACSPQESEFTELAGCDTGDKAACLSGRAPDGTPCCWHSDGFADADDLCLPKGDPGIDKHPLGCHKTVNYTWPEMPECVQKCENPFKPLLMHLIVSDGCDKCLAGKSCDCTVKCNKTEQHPYERYGGGPEGARSCTADNLKFEAEPYCALEEATPICPSPAKDQSIEIHHCEHGCDMNDASCKCKVECEEGYAIHSTSTVQEGELKCIPDDSWSLEDTTCGSKTGEDGCLSSQEGGKPCCWMNEKRPHCLPKGHEAITSENPPFACAPLRKSKWEGVPYCKKLCVNAFATQDFLAVQNCDGCFVEEECHCEVKCQNSLKIAGEYIVDGKCDADGNFPEGPTCNSSTMPDSVKCSPAPKTENNARIVSKGCKKCTTKACTDCSVTCAQDYKRTGGGDEGAKTCTETTYLCPKKTQWSEEAGCIDAESKKFTKSMCCPEWHFSHIDLNRVANCADLTEKGVVGTKGPQCLGSETEANPCCWGFDGKCVEYGTAVVEQCAHRNRVLNYTWDEMPVCEETCDSEFEVDGVKVEGECNDCVAGKDCNCKVTCKDDLTRYGGGPEGDKSCNTDKQIGEAPVCGVESEIEPPPTCGVPQGTGVRVKNPDVCKQCAAGDPDCKCEAECADGYVPAQGTDGGSSLECEAFPGELTTTSCSSVAGHHGREACLTSKEEDGTPCCYHGDAFESHWSAWHQTRCLPKGNVGIKKVPEACTPLESAEWAGVPECVVKCTHDWVNTENITMTGCDTCAADNCACEVKCKDGLVRYGGGAEGPRSCSAEKPEFEAAPVCGAKPPDPVCPSPFHDGSLVIAEACMDCIAGQPCPACSITCDPATHIPVGDVQEIKCSLINKFKPDMYDRRCTGWAKNDRDMCVRTHDGDTPCCWTKHGCKPQGAADIFEVPLECAPTKHGDWGDLPQCKQKCKHDFKEVPHIKYDPQKCNNCGADQPCDCKVECEDDTELYGGEEGIRQCTASDPQLGPAPVCALPTKVTCKAPSSNEGPFGTTVGCAGCHVGEACDCTIGCNTAEGFAGEETKPVCEASPLTLKHRVCTTLQTETECLQSQDKGEPCCWRPDGFKYEGFRLIRCAAKKSRLITPSRPHEKCAATHEGMFIGLPACEAPCTNVFKDNPLLDVKGCESCTGGSECECEVSCKAPAVLVGSVEEGTKRCLGSADGLKASFEDAPECSVPCLPPDNAGGTLDLSKCTQPCFEGQDSCNCDVQCAYGNQRVGGGRVGRKYCHKDGKGGFAFNNIPECKPQCKPPSDSYGSLDVTMCTSTCNAGDSSCECHVRCADHTAVNHGGKEGKKICKFFPADETSTSAWAEWVDEDTSTDKWNRLPECMSPIKIRTVAAANKRIIKDVKVELFADEEMQRVVDTVSTDETEGRALFYTGLRFMTFKASHPEYNDYIWMLDRELNCKDPLNCGAQFSMVAKMQSGELHPDNCAFASAPGKEDFKMTAVLEWDETPADLDIWVRPFDCFEKMAKIIGCDSKSKESTCDRSKFTDSKVRRDLGAQCTQSKVLRDPPTWGDATKFTDKYPVIHRRHLNQFPKWVYWDSRYITDIPNNIRSTKNQHPWNPDHYMVLDVDKRNGEGPETVTFSNVPPGLYQIAVSQFSKADASKNIKAGNPRITLYLGGNSVVIKCNMDPNCKRNSAVWNVANLVIDYNGPGEGGNSTWSVRILDQQSTMQKIRQVELPTIEKKQCEKRNFFQQCIEERFIVGSQDDYSSSYLSNVCYGSCEVNQGSDPRFNSCLFKNGR